MGILRIQPFQLLTAGSPATRGAYCSIRLVAHRNFHGCYSRRDEQSTKPAGGPNQIQIEFKIEPLPRPGESIEHKRARLLYQSRKRGILETDLLLSRFAKSYLDSFSAEQLEEYDRFLDEYDWDIYYWVTDNPQRTVPERWKDSEVFKLLKIQVQTQGKEILRMPDL
ncbi:Flavinator of succinate dehydrogenase-domain-containing protein [Lipomyces kononenkoae]